MWSLKNKVKVIHASTYEKEKQGGARKRKMEEQKGK